MRYKNIEFEAIIAVPGCGKSFLCDQNRDKYVDVDEVRLKLKYVVPKNITRDELEATKGDRSFERRMHTSEYISALYETLDRERVNGKILIAAPHPESFDYFVSRNIKFCFIYADKSMREELKERYKKRGNNQKFIDENDGLFEAFLESNAKEDRAAVTYIFSEGEYLSDIISQFSDRE